MHTKESLIADILALGIMPADIITAHTSLKAIGKIDDREATGAEVLISALQSCIPEGLLVIPSHTYVNIRKDPVFDIRRTMPCIGTLPRVAVEMANRAYELQDKTCIRSFHPSHSVVAFGKNAWDFVKDDRLAQLPMADSGCYDKLYQLGAKILLIGVGLERNTFIHRIDETFCDTYLAEGSIIPLDKYPITGIDYDGSVHPQLARNCNQPAPSRYYPQYQPLLEKAGALRRGKIGDADVLVCDAKKTFDAISKAIQDGFRLVVN